MLHLAQERQSHGISEKSRKITINRDRAKLTSLIMISDATVRNYFANSALNSAPGYDRADESEVYGQTLNAVLIKRLPR